MVSPITGFMEFRTGNKYYWSVYLVYESNIVEPVDIGRFGYSDGDRFKEKYLDHLKKNINGVMMTRKDGYLVEVHLDKPSKDHRYTHKGWLK